MKTGYFDAVLSDGGKPIAATVTVYLPGTSTKATIYTDKNGTVQKDNPFQTDSYGRFNFYATAGSYYDIEISGTGITTYKLQNVSIPWTTMKAKARAWRNADQTGIADQTWTKLQLDQENDPGGNYDNVTNFRFTIPRAGYYLINAQVCLSSYVTLKRYLLSVYFDGAEGITAEVAPTSASASPTIGISTWQYLNAGSYIELFFWHNAGTTVSVKGNWGKTFLTVHLLST
jgi:hypothetical protein